MVQNLKDLFKRINIKVAIMIGFILCVAGKPAGATGRNEGQTGFTVVSEEGLSIDSIPAPMSTQWIARYDYRVIRPEEREFASPQTAGCCPVAE